MCGHRQIDTMTRRRRRRVSLWKFVCVCVLYQQQQQQQFASNSVQLARTAGCELTTAMCGSPFKKRTNRQARCERSDWLLFTSNAVINSSSSFCSNKHFLDVINKTAQYYTVKVVVVFARACACAKPLHFFWLA